MDILKEIDPNLLDSEGDLKPGVQIITADDGRIIAEGKDKPNLHGKDPERFPSNNFQPGDPMYLDENFTGDYCEFRDVLLLRRRHLMVDAMTKLSKARLALLREHLLQLSAYHEQYKSVSYEVALIATRVLASDWETDKEMEDTEFDLGDMEGEDADDEAEEEEGEAEEANMPKDEGKKPLMACS
jgi:hypothetical protein